MYIDLFSTVEIDMRENVPMEDIISKLEYGMVDQVIKELNGNNIGFKDRVDYESDSIKRKYIMKVTIVTE